MDFLTILLALFTYDCIKASVESILKLILEIIEKSEEE